MKTVIITLLCAVQAHAACGSIDTDVYYCPGGDPTTVGADLRAFIGDSSNFNCGSTIILEAGQVYLGLHDSVNSYPFVLASQTCAPGKRTKITTTRAAEMPWVYRPTLADIPRMATLKTAIGKNTGRGSVLMSYPDAMNGWFIEGIVFTTDSAISQTQHDWLAAPEVNISSPSEVSLPADAVKDITLFHCLATNGEEETFGPLIDCLDIACTLRSTTGAWVMGGLNLELTSSSAYGQGGFVPDCCSALENYPGIAFPSAGTSCHVGETFTINGGADLAEGEITAVDGSNHVTAIDITYGGWGYSFSNSGGAIVWDTTMTSGTCTGLQMYLKAGDNTHYPITAATNEVSPQVTATGISALVGVHSGANGCTDGVTGRLRCTQVCWKENGNFPGCQLVLAEGFPSDWTAAGIGGAMFAIYVDANTVALSHATRDENWYIVGSPIDTTSLSAYSSGAVIRPSGPKIDPVYQWQGGGNDTRMINIMIPDGDMTLFTGSGGYTTSIGDVTASTFDTMTQTGTIDVTVVNAPVTGIYAGAAVGDVVACVAPGVSTWCNQPPGNACAAGGDRGSIINSISGTLPNLHFEVGPAGAIGMDVPCTVGGKAQWRGLLNTRMMMTRSHIVRNAKAFPTGKGPFETKSAKLSFWDGNQMDWSPFHETKNQSVGGTPEFIPSGTAAGWSTCVDTIFSNSWWGVGGLNIKNSSAAQVNGNDYESANTETHNCRFDNNLSAAMAILPGYTAYAPNWGYVDDQSGVFHTTMYVDPSQSPSGNWFPNAYIPLHCGQDGIPGIDNPGKTHVIYKDNIMSYGNTINTSVMGENCWPNQDSGAVMNNGMIDDKSVGSSTILAAWPLANLVADTFDDVMFTCGTLSSCATAGTNQILGHALDPMSPFKAAASDGRDMGADVYKINDRLNGYSVEAGLERYNSRIARTVYTAGAFNMGSTRAALTFTVFNGTAGCNFILYDDPSRDTENADTNSSGEKLCTRSGNVVQGTTVTFVLGTNSALSANTTYYYMIVDGSRIMVGEFTTRAADITSLALVTLNDATATDALIQYSASADMSSPSTTSPVSFSGDLAKLTYSPAGGVHYWRWQKRDSMAAVIQSGLINVVFRAPSGGLSWAALTNTDWTTMSNGQWTALGN